MKSPIETIRLSQRAKDNLAKLVRYTGIRHRNVLCRWGFCASLAEPTIPPPATIPADSNLEISWHVFGGQYEDIYFALLKLRCRKDGLPLTDESLATQFRLHLHRGIAYLAAGKPLRTIDDLISLGLDAAAER